MAQEIFIAIISSSVLTAIITSIIGIIQGNKKNQLERITDERKVWRDSLRQFVEELQKENEYGKVLNLLARLKVRINAFGMNYEKEDGRKDDYFLDEHIWRMIEDFECDENKYSNITINKFKLKLIKSISCLLKSDWERSKQNPFAVR